MVIGQIEVCTSVDGASYQVLVAQSYNATDILEEGSGSGEGKTEVTAEVESIADGDVVCPWGGATASTSTMPSHGPNYGYWALRDMWARTNIQTATGACSTAISTFQGTTVTRAAAGNFGWLIPSIVAKSGAQITWADFDSLWMNLDLVKHGEPANFALCNPLVLQSLANQAGVAGHRFNGSATSATERLFAKYGVSGVVYQSVVGSPVVLVADNHVAPDQMLAPVAGAIRRLSPAPVRFVPNAISGIWQRRTNGDGKQLYVYDAQLHESQQLMPTDQLRLCGGITGGKP